MNADRDFLDELIQKSFAEEMTPPEGFQENLLRQVRMANGGRKSWIPAICAAASLLALFIGGMILWQGQFWDRGSGKENYQEACRPTGKEEPLQESGKSGDGSRISDKRRVDNGGEGGDDAGTPRLTTQQNDLRPEGSGQNGGQRPPVSAPPGTSRPDAGDGGSETYYEVAGVEDDAPTPPAGSQTEAPAEVKLPGGVVVPGGDDGQETPTLKTAAPSMDMSSAVPKETLLPTLVPSSASAPPEGIFCKVTSFVWEERMSSPAETPAETIMPAATKETTSVEGGTLETSRPASTPETSWSDSTPEISQPDSTTGVGDDSSVWNPSGVEGIRVIGSTAAFSNMIKSLRASSMEQQHDTDLCNQLLQQYDERYFKTHMLCAMMTEEAEGSRFDFVEARETDGFLYITLRCQRGEEKEGETRKVLYLCVVEVDRRPSGNFGKFQIRITY